MEKLQHCTVHDFEGAKEKMQESIKPILQQLSNCIA